jgi:hypothetical protein
MIASQNSLEANMRPVANDNGAKSIRSVVAAQTIVLITLSGRPNIPAFPDVDYSEFLVIHHPPRQPKEYLILH